MSQVSSPSGLSGHDSIVKVLTRGSSIGYVSLENIELHLRKHDKAAWEMIRNRLMDLSVSEFNTVMDSISQIEGVQFNTGKLIHLLLQLPGGQELEKKFNQ